MRNLRILFLSECLTTVLFIISCDSEQGPQPVDCLTSGLNLTVATVNDASGCTTNDGSATLSASGGAEPYQYKLNDGILQSSATFNNLNPDSYTATVVDDNNCEAETTVQISSGAGSLAFTTTPTATEAGCGTTSATITVEATGEGTVQYKLDEGNFSTTNVFENVSAGTHNVTITDDSGCTTSAEVKVLSGTSYETEVKPIIMNNCAISGCHDGSTARPDWTVFSNVQNNAENIKSRTQAGEMPPAGSGSLTQEQIDLIACWVDDGAMEN